MTNLTSEQTSELLQTLAERFKKNMDRHPGLKWENIQTKLEANPKKLWSLSQMESTGGEPDVVAYDKKTDTYIFFDCSPESPKGRRSLCYDEKALNSRKEFKPKDSATNLAKNMGVELLNEEEYRYLQSLGEFDLKTSSWIETPEEIRKHGGAVYQDRRYNHVFLYHNGAESYYAVRGFRTSLKV
ncbi:DUF4256 domain-containing protein [Patescibacteria group bacterium]|nr:DUF4256 domain-containing protein [Patescibacteria group bacterium]